MRARAHERVRMTFVRPSSPSTIRQAEGHNRAAHSSWQRDKTSSDRSSERDGDAATDRRGAWGARLRRRRPPHSALLSLLATHAIEFFNTLTRSTSMAEHRLIVSLGLTY